MDFKRIISKKRININGLYHLYDQYPYYLEELGHYGEIQINLDTYPYEILCSEMYGGFLLSFCICLVYDSNDDKYKSIIFTQLNNCTAFTLKQKQLNGYDDYFSLSQDSSINMVIKANNFITNKSLNIGSPQKHTENIYLALRNQSIKWYPCIATLQDVYKINCKFINIEIELTAQNVPNINSFNDDDNNNNNDENIVFDECKQIN